MLNWMVADLTVGLDAVNVVDEFTESKSANLQKSRTDRCRSLLPQ